MEALKPLPIGPTVTSGGNLITGNGPHLRVINQDTGALTHETLDLIERGSINLIVPVHQKNNTFYVVCGDDRTVHIIDGTTYEEVEILYLRNRFAGMVTVPSSNPSESAKLDDDTEFVAVDKFGDFLKLTLRDIRVLSFTEKLRTLKHAAINPKDQLVLDWGRQILGLSGSTPHASIPWDQEILACEETLGSLYGGVIPTDDDALTLEQYAKGSNSMMAMSVRLITMPDTENPLCAVADKDERIMVTPLNRVYETYGYCLGHELFVTDMQMVRVKEEVLLATISADKSFRLWRPDGRCLYVESSLPSRPNASDIPSSLTLHTKGSTLHVVIGWTDGSLHHLTLTVEDRTWSRGVEVEILECDGIGIQNVLFLDNEIRVIRMNGIIERGVWQEGGLILERIFEPECPGEGVTENFLKHSYLKTAPTQEQRREKRLRGKYHGTNPDHANKKMKKKEN